MAKMELGLYENEESILFLLSQLLLNLIIVTLNYCYSYFWFLQRLPWINFIPTTDFFNSYSKSILFLHLHFFNYYPESILFRRLIF